MLRSRLAHSVIAAAALALCSSLMLVALVAAPAATAEAQDNVTYVTHGKADRLDASRKGVACSERGWPHYEQQCLFDRTRANNEAGSIRVIAIR